MFLWLCLLLKYLCLEITLILLLENAKEKKNEENSRIHTITMVSFIKKKTDKKTAKRNLNETWRKYTVLKNPVRKILFFSLSSL